MSIDISIHAEDTHNEIYFNSVLFIGLDKMKEALKYDLLYELTYKDIDSLLYKSTRVDLNELEKVNNQLKVLEMKFKNQYEKTVIWFYFEIIEELIKKVINYLKNNNNLKCYLYIG